MKISNYKIAPRMAWRVIEDKAYVFDPQSSELHELSETATFIWLAIDRGEETQTIASTIADEYEISPETALKDVLKLLGEFLKKGLIQ